MKKKRTRIIIVSISILAVLLGLLVWSFYYTDWNYHITISPETTYITEPLLPDGRVDYISAINAKLGQGVTPDQNAAIPFYRLVGFYESLLEDKDSLHKFYKLLGAKPEDLEPTTDQPRMVAFNDYLETKIDREVLIKEIEAAKLHEISKRMPEHIDDDDSLSTAIWALGDHLMTTPWSADQFPSVARWLEENSASLRAFIEASKLPKLYAPIVVSTDKKIYYLRSYPNSGIGVYCLAIRAMLEIEQHRYDEAWEDILAIKRTARLFADRSTTVSYLHGSAIELLVLDPAIALLSNPELPEERLREYLNDLKLFRTFPKIELPIYRLQYLADYEDSPSSIPSKITSPHDRALRNVIRVRVDWDTILRRVNDIYDEFEVRLAEPVRPMRIREIEAMEERYHGHIDDVRELTLGNTLFTLSVTDLIFKHHLTHGMFSYTIYFLKRESQTLARIRFTEIAARLALHRQITGKYPESLDLLRDTPSGVDPPDADLFDDPFHDSDTFRYTVMDDGDGYLLYSVNLNGRDDNGRDERERPDLPDDPGDDFGIRVGPEGFIPWEIWNVEQPAEVVEE